MEFVFFIRVHQTMASGRILWVMGMCLDYTFDVYDGAMDYAYITTETDVWLGQRMLDEGYQVP